MIIVADGTLRAGRYRLDDNLSGYPAMPLE